MFVVGRVIFWYAVMMVDDARGRAAVAATMGSASFMAFPPPSVSQKVQSVAG